MNRILHSLVQVEELHQEVFPPQVLQLLLPRLKLLRLDIKHRLYTINAERM
jgi:hypothetical protein